MNTAVAKNLAKIGLLVALIVIATGATANAQSLQYPLKANIPFDFNVGNKKLPAGKYSFQRAQPSSGDLIVQISSIQGHTTVNQTTMPKLTFTPNNKGVLIFHRYGDEYFLAQVWPASSETGRELVKSRAERDVQRKTHDYVGMAATKAPQVETITIVADLQ